LGREVINKKIILAKDKSLLITGHSLGGGLASAVCCVLAYEYPDFYIQSLIFNAAGVHRNTIKRELNLKGEAAKAMAFNPCRDICVRDEILTTLGVHYKKLPVLGGIFSMIKREIGQYGFPDPSDIAKVTDIKAISPGTAVEEEKNGHVEAELPPKGAALPILFPIDQQNAMPPPKNGFPIIMALDGILNASPDIGILATRFFEFLNDRYGKEARDNNWMFWNTYKEMFEKFIEELKLEIEVIIPVLALCSAYHGMDVVIASYENMLVERRLKKTKDDQQQQQREQEQKNQLETWKEQQRQKREQERLRQEQEREAEEERKKREIEERKARLREELERLRHANPLWGWDTI